jgi:hypothetical protein
MTPLRRLSLVTALLAGLHSLAYAQNAIDCDDATQARTYATDFDTRLKDTIASGKAKEETRQQAYEAAKQRIVDAGIWSEQEAHTFMLKTAMGGPEGKELETRRAKATREFKTLLFTLDGLPLITAGDKQAERRGLCIFGQRVFAQLGIIDDTSRAAWQLVNEQVSAFGRQKGVEGF